MTDQDDGAVISVEIDKLLPIQLRAAMSREAIEDYSKAMDNRKAGGLPPITVFHDAHHDSWWIADGVHRWEAARLREQKTIRAVVKPGTKRDAIIYAASANAKHGLRRTNADKRNVVSKFLTDAEWSKRSDRWIAATCAVSHVFVGELRRELQATGDASSDTTRQTADGRTMDTSRIGKPKPKDEALSKDELPPPVAEAIDRIADKVEDILTGKPWMIAKRSDGYWFHDPDGELVGPYKTQAEAGEDIRGLKRTFAELESGDERNQGDEPLVPLSDIPLSPNTRLYAFDPDLMMSAEITPSTEHAGYYYVATYEDLDTDAGSVVYTKRPIAAAAVALVLQTRQFRASGPWESEPFDGAKPWFITAPGKPAPAGRRS